MMRRKSFIADNIMKEYYKKQRYKKKEEFIQERCKNCKNRNKDLCDIRLTIDGEWKCVYYEI